MDAWFELKNEGWFYILEDGPKQGPFETREAAEEHLGEAIASVLAAYTEEVLFGNSKGRE